MTREEAIKNLKELLAWYLDEEEGYSETFYKKEAIDIAIKSLEQEPKQGQWDKGYTFPDGDYWKCTNCKELIKVKYPMKYCNNCGSKNE